jgi:hypothetical protein
VKAAFEFPEGGAPAPGTVRVRQLESLLEYELGERFETVVKRPPGRFEVDGGAAIYLECAAGGAFLCIEPPKATPMTARWVPTEITRFHHRALLGVIDDAVRYVAESLPYRAA